MVTVLIALAALTAPACGTGPKPIAAGELATDDPAAERAFETARAKFDAGELDEADSAFATFARDFSGDPLVSAAIIYRARIALTREDPPRARVLLDPLVVSGGTGPSAERASLYHGVAWYRLGKAERALEQLAPFVDRLTDPHEHRLLLDTLWRAARDCGETARAMIWLDVLLELGGVDAHAGEVDGWLADLASQLTEPSVAEDLAGELNPGGRAWPAVMARRIELLFEQGDLEAAETGLDEVREAGHGEELAVEEVAELVEQRADVDLGAVGCILPLSGRSRLVGDAVLRGVMLGSRVIRFGEDEHSLSVVIRDSEGDPQRAADAVESLVLEDNVAAIVGPVDGESALAAARKAEELGVPLLTLTSRVGVGERGRNVFRQFSSARAEVTALVARARELGGSSFAVLYPNGDYGEAMRQTLRRVLTEQNLQPVLEQGYDPTKTSFVEEAEQISAAEFDVLFVPDVSKRLALIAPALAAAGLWVRPVGEDAPQEGQGRPILLIATAPAISPDLVRRAGKYLQGALFTTSFHVDASPGAADLADRFETEYKRAPTYFEAYGHDALLLVAAAIDSGARTRAGIRGWIARADASSTAELGLAAPFDGFSGEGEATAQPWILTITEAGFEVLR
ncbi:MAG: ABC transporter substrate-binding protein [Deltaproteobacteria bacterium]|nr:ABC transporter substrate-binding protein [Deltaproteobacteria bacterium]